jgi:hypothetical protein
MITNPKRSSQIEKQLSNTYNPKATSIDLLIFRNTIWISLSQLRERLIPGNSENNAITEPA